MYGTYLQPCVSSPCGLSSLLWSLAYWFWKKTCWNKSPPKPKPSGEKILPHFVLTNNKNSYRIEKKSCEVQLPPFSSWKRNIQHESNTFQNGAWNETKQKNWSYFGIKFYQLQGVCVEKTTSPKETSALRQIWTKTTRMTPAEILWLTKNRIRGDPKILKKIGMISANGYIYLLIYPQQISNFVYIPTNLP